MRLEMQKASSTKFIGATAAKLDASSVEEINKEIDCYLYSEWWGLFPYGGYYTV